MEEADHLRRRRVRGQAEEDVAGDDLEPADLLANRDKLPEERLILALGVVERVEHLLLDRDAGAGLRRKSTVGKPNNAIAST